MENNMRPRPQFYSEEVFEAGLNDHMKEIILWNLYRKQIDEYGEVIREFIEITPEVKLALESAFIQSKPNNFMHDAFIMAKMLDDDLFPQDTEIFYMCKEFLEIAETYYRKIEHDWLVKNKENKNE